MQENDRNIFDTTWSNIDQWKFGNALIDAHNATLVGRVAKVANNARWSLKRRSAHAGRNTVLDRSCYTRLPICNVRSQPESKHSEWSHASDCQLYWTWPLHLHDIQGSH